MIPTAHFYESFIAKSKQSLHSDRVELDLIDPFIISFINIKKSK